MMEKMHAKDVGFEATVNLNHANFFMDIQELTFMSAVFLYDVMDGMLDSDEEEE